MNFWEFKCLLMRLHGGTERMFEQGMRIEDITRQVAAYCFEFHLYNFEKQMVIDMIKLRSQLKTLREEGILDLDCYDTLALAV